MRRSNVIDLTPEVAHDNFDSPMFPNMELVANDDTMEAVVFEIDGEIVAYGGVRRLPWDMCEGFFHALPGTPPYVFVQARKVWNEMTAGVKRAQFIVNILEPNHIRFGYSLGLIPEGVLRHAGPNGEDFIMFVRIR